MVNEIRHRQFRYIVMVNTIKEDTFKADTIKENAI